MRPINKNISVLCGFGFLFLLILGLHGYAYADDSENTGKAERSEGPIEITLEDAVQMAFENNSMLRVEKINPEIEQTYEDQEKAAFDPLLTGNAEVTKEKSRSTSTASRPSPAGAVTESPDLITKETDAKIQLTKPFSSGTKVSASALLNRIWTNRPTKRYKTRVGLRITQSFLKNAGRNVNMAGLRQAKLKTQMSIYELRGFSETLLAEIEASYWEYALSLSRVEIVEESLNLARQQQKDTQEMINVGLMAETEIIATEAEIALRLQYLIDAQSKNALSRLRLLQLMNPAGQKVSKQQVMLITEPVISELNPDDVEAYIATAIEMRPDLNQAKLNLQRNDLEILKTKNGLLPKLDLFIALGKTGYADTFKESVNDIDGRRYDIMAGVDFEFPVRNRDAEAHHRRALLSRAQAEEAVNNLSQLVELDIHNACIELTRTRQQLFASRSTRELQKEKLRIETEKFKVGRSTNFLVAQAQRDFMLSSINEKEAVVNSLKAVTNLFRMEGTLLKHRGIQIPNQQKAE